MDVNLSEHQRVTPPSFGVTTPRFMRALVMAFKNFGPHSENIRCFFLEIVFPKVQKFLLHFTNFLWHHLLEDTKAFAQLFRQIGFPCCRTSKWDKAIPLFSGGAGSSPSYPPPLNMHKPQKTCAY